MKNSFYIIVTLLCFSWCYSQTSKPNIILIVADDLGWGDVGYNGQKYIKTPQIDQLAKEGMIFNNFYAGSTVCGPSRASLITGKHTGHSSVRENPRWTANGLPVDLSLTDVTVAEELKRAGYTTGIIGKWGLGENLGSGVPNKQGFDYFYGFNRHKVAHHHYPDSIWENDTYKPIKGNNWKKKQGQFVQDLFTEKAKEFVVSNKSEPFFLYLAYTTPHYELTVPEESKADYVNQNWPQRKMFPGHYLHDQEGHTTYAGMVSRMDAQIGEIIALLKEKGIDKNTMVIFTSDNGHEYDKLAQPFFDSNGPYRGRKRDLYEGGVKVPFVVRWPAKIKAGSKTNHIAAFWDFLPTFCDMAKLKPSDATDGISFLPTLKGKRKQKKHQHLYWEFNESKGPTQAIRKGQWKLVKRFKKPIELYDIENDPGEAENIASKYPDKVSELQLVLESSRTPHPEFPLIKLNPYKKKTKK